VKNRGLTNATIAAGNPAATTQKTTANPTRSAVETDQNSSVVVRPGDSIIGCHRLSLQLSVPESSEEPVTLPDGPVCRVA